MANNSSLSMNGQILNLDVRAFKYQDEMSGLFDLTLDVFSADPAIDMSTLVGQKVIFAAPSEPLFPNVSGFISKMWQVTCVLSGISEYKIKISPLVWILSQKTDQRIFQNLSVPEIVGVVLSGYGGFIDPVAFLLSNIYPKIEYRVQYRETDIDFVQRILAEEGISYFFDHSNNSVFTLVDNTAVSPTVDLVPFIDPNTAVTSVPHVFDIQSATKVSASGQSLRDYNFKNPTFIPIGSAAITNPSPAEVGLTSYEFDLERFLDDRNGGARATRLLESSRAANHLFTLKSNFSFHSGRKMSINGHPRLDINIPMLVIFSSVTVDLTKSSNSSYELKATPGAIHFRPMRRPKPYIEVTETAFVVGLPGEEITVDNLGRVEVDFIWDVRDKFTAGSSRMIRVSQGWSGVGYGMMHVPRVGEEVIVSYLNGDPDEPIIIGRVHNAVAVPPLKLPDEKDHSIWRSKSTPKSIGFNEIRMIDTAGAEKLTLRAELDRISDTQRDEQLVVGRNRATTIVGDDETTVNGKGFVTVGGDHKGSFGGNGTYTFSGPLTIGAGNINIVSNGPLVESITGERTCFADGVDFELKDTFELTCTNMLVAAAADIFLFIGGTQLHMTDGNLTLSCGGSKIVMTEGKITITAGLIELNP